MTLRVKMTVGATIYDSASEDFKFFELSRTQQVDVFQRHTGKTVIVAAAATEAVDLGDFQASPENIRGMLVEADQDCDLLINFGAGDQTIPLRIPNPSATSANKARLFLDSIPTALTVDNTAGSSNVNVIVAVWGSATS